MLMCVEGGGCQQGAAQHWHNVSWRGLEAFVLMIKVLKVRIESVRVIVQPRTHDAEFNSEWGWSRFRSAAASFTVKQKKEVILVSCFCCWSFKCNKTNDFICLSSQSQRPEDAGNWQQPWTQLRLQPLTVISLTGHVLRFSSRRMFCPD